MKKTLYIYRHGQTAFNALGRVQGRGVNEGLNDLGRKQANAFFEYYKNEGFDLLVCSALRRTAQTIAPFVQLGIPLFADEGFDEISWGIYEGQDFRNDFQEAYDSLLTAWSSGDYTAKAPKGESPSEVENRQRKAMDLLIETDAQKILICMHGRAMRILFAWMLQMPLSEMDAFEHKNTSLYVLKYEDGKYKMFVHNSLKHLF